MRSRAFPFSDYAPLLALSIASVTEPNTRVKDHSHRETMIAGVEPAPGPWREGFSGSLVRPRRDAGACGGSNDNCGGWVRRIVRATIRSVHSRENLRSASRIQAYIAKLGTSSLHQVHRASIVSLLQNAGG